MATRALAAAVAGSRVAGQSVFPALASIRSGGARSNSRGRGAHTRAEEYHDAAAAAQVEAALNSKNVEEVARAAPATTVLPDEAVRDADSAWVPDQDTGVFVPAEEAAACSSGNGAHAGSSVLDQTVFNREEEMEDVERPAVYAGAE